MSIFTPTSTPADGIRTTFLFPVLPTYILWNGVSQVAGDGYTISGPVSGSYVVTFKDFLGNVLTPASGDKLYAADGSGTSFAPTTGTAGVGTYTISDALNIANRTMPRAVEDDSAAFIASTAIAYIWKRYDWRETLNTLPPFWLIPLTQDYGAPFYAVPQDFYGLKLVYLVQTTSTPVTRWEVPILKNPRLESSQGFATAIGYVPETRSMRVYPVPTAGIGPTQFLIDGTYKMRPPLITASALNSTLVPWDDMYIMEFVTALRWASAKVTGSGTANNIQQELDYLLDEMATAEGLQLGDQPIAPSESIYGQGDVGWASLGYGLIF